MSGTTSPPPVADRATLEAWLAAAQAARHKLLIGSQVESVSYQQGDGQRTVKYMKSDLPTLNAYIAELQAGLGYRVRRAIGVVF